MNSIISDNNNLNNTLHDFEIAHKQLQKAIENSDRAQENLKKTKTNFQTYNKIIKNSNINNLTQFGMQTIDEKVKQLEDQFTTCIIEDSSDEHIIIMDKGSNDK